MAAAARRVGMTRESAYRLRRREGAEGFCRAWDVALTPSGRRGQRGRSEPRAFTLTECVVRSAGESALAPAPAPAPEPSKPAAPESHRSWALAASKITPEIAQHLTIAELRYRAEAGTYCPLMRGRRYGGYYHEDGFRAQHALAERLLELAERPSKSPEERTKDHAFKNSFGVTPAARYNAADTQLRG